MESGRSLITIHFYIILNSFRVMGSLEKFEYHTFLHHSQTRIWNWSRSEWFEYHYIFTSFSNAFELLKQLIVRLSTIHFYIILKLAQNTTRRGKS